MSLLSRRDKKYLAFWNTLIYLKYIYIYMYIYIYIYIYIHKFHAVLSTIFSHLTLTLNCYNAMVSSWRHLISLVTKWKTNSSSVMAQHIRERSRKPSILEVEDGAETLESPLLMLKHTTVVYFQLPQWWCIIVCLQTPCCKNRKMCDASRRYHSTVTI